MTYDLSRNKNYLSTLFFNLTNTICDLLFCRDNSNVIEVLEEKKERISRRTYTLTPSVNRLKFVCRFRMRFRMRFRILSFEFKCNSKIIKSINRHLNLTFKFVYLLKSTI